MTRMTDKDTPPRKPLRERVADRKRGIAPPESAKTIVWRRRLSFAATVLQGVGIILLLIYMVEFVANGMTGANYMVIGLYSIIFIVGRFLKIAVDMHSAANRRR